MKYRIKHDPLPDVSLPETESFISEAEFKDLIQKLKQAGYTIMYEVGKEKGMGTVLVKPYLHEPIIAARFDPIYE